MAKFRKKPVEIEAVQWFPNVAHPGVQEDKSKLLTDFYSPSPGSAMRDLPAYFVTTVHEQRAYLVPGDWISKPDIFASTYDSI